MIHPVHQSIRLMMVPVKQYSIVLINAQGLEMRLLFLVLSFMEVVELFPMTMSWGDV